MSLSSLFGLFGFYGFFSSSFYAQSSMLKAESSMLKAYKYHRRHSGLARPGAI